MTNKNIEIRVRQIFESGSYGSDLNLCPFDADDMVKLAHDCVFDATDQLIMGSSRVLPSDVKENL